MSDKRQKQAKQIIANMQYGKNCSEAVRNNVTVIIKTLERPYCLALLLKSICLHWGKIPVLVCDDSREPLYPDQAQPQQNIKWLTLDFNAGHTLGAGRNYLVDQAETEYVFLCDDDHAITAQTRLQAMYDFLQQSGYDLVAGAQGREEYGAANFEQQGKVIIQKFHQHYGLVAPDIVACDRVSNTFLARRKALQQVRWQDKVYGLEHADFFIRGKQQGLKVAQMGKTWVDHDRGSCEQKTGWLGYLLGRWLPHQDGFYRKLRSGAKPEESELLALKKRQALYKKYVLDVHGIDKIVDDYNKEREQAMFELIGYPDEPCNG